VSAPVRRPTAKLAKVRHTVGRMNGYEKEYERLFLMQKPHGFEQWTFRLGDDCRYTPDFWVQEEDDTISMIEVKGHWRDGAKEKIRIASEMYPMFRWQAFRRVKKVWQVEHFGLKDVA
jgi:hypothetical protein